VRVYKEYFNDTRDGTMDAKIFLAATRKQGWNTNCTQEFSWSNGVTKHYYWVIEYWTGDREKDTYGGYVEEAETSACPDRSK